MRKSPDISYFVGNTFIEFSFEKSLRKYDSNPRKKVKRNLQPKNHLHLQKIKCQQCLSKLQKSSVLANNERKNALMQQSRRFYHKKTREKARQYSSNKIKNKYQNSEKTEGKNNSVFECEVNQFEQNFDDNPISSQIQLCQNHNLKLNSVEKLQRSNFNLKNLEDQINPWNEKYQQCVEKQQESVASKLKNNDNGQAQENLQAQEKSNSQEININTSEQNVSLKPHDAYNRTIYQILPNQKKKQKVQVNFQEQKQKMNLPGQMKKRWNSTLQNQSLGLQEVVQPQFSQNQSNFKVSKQLQNPGDFSRNGVNLSSEQNICQAQVQNQPLHFQQNEDQFCNNQKDNALKSILQSNINENLQRKQIQKRSHQFQKVEIECLGRVKLTGIGKENQNLCISIRNFNKFLDQDQGRERIVEQILLHRPYLKKNIKQLNQIVTEIIQKRLNEKQAL